MEKTKYTYTEKLAYAHGMLEKGWNMFRINTFLKKYYSATKEDLKRINLEVARHSSQALGILPNFI